MLLRNTTCRVCGENFQYNGNDTSYPKCPHCKRKKEKREFLKTGIRRDFE